MSASPRIAPADPPYPPRSRRRFDALMPPGVAPLVLFRALARDQRLFQRFMGGGLLDKGHLTLRQREIVIDRVTARCGSEYEWGVHVAFFAKRAGLDEAQLRSLVRGGPGDACWSAEDALLIRFCDALHAELRSRRCACGPSCARNSARRRCWSCCCSPASTARCPTSPTRCACRSSPTPRGFRREVVSSLRMTPYATVRRSGLAYGSGAERSDTSTSAIAWRRLGRRAPDLLQARGAAAGGLVVLIAVRVLLVVVLVVVLGHPERRRRAGSWWRSSP